jgi:hypothetical protein
MLSLNAATTALSGLGRKQPILPNFRQRRSAIRQILYYSAFFLMCIMLGLFYGFAVALFPPQLLIYLGLPVMVLLFVVIWALPDTGHGPVRLLSFLFFLYFAIVILWPRYLAIHFSGLPWISFRRLTGFPMVLIFTICLSMSSQVRNEIKAILASVKPLTRMLIAFTIWQAVTLFFSQDMFHSVDSLLNYWFLYTLTFFIGLWVLSRPKASERFVNMLIGMALLVCVIAGLEVYNGQVLWMNHIPSFLKLEDEGRLATYLSSTTRDGEYRAVATFGHTLVLAEYLSLITPFIVHRLINSKDLRHKLGWLLLDLVILGGINLTQSRLGVVGWLLAHLAYGSLWALHSWRHQRTNIVAPAAALGVLGSGLFLLVGMFSIPAIRNRTIGGGSTGFSDAARQEQFMMMWPKLLDNPFGYGAGRSGQTLQYRLPGGTLTTDSYIITVLLDYGILGFLLFFGMFIYMAVTLCSQWWRRDIHSQSLALPVAVSLIVLIQVRTVLSQVDNLPLFYMLLALAVAVLVKQRTGLNNSTSPARPV